MNHHFSIILTGIAVLACGLITFFVWAQPTLANSEASVNWPRTIGHVLTSKVVETKKNKRRQKRNIQVTMYHPEVGFKYEVDGHTYSSSNIFFGLVSESESAVRAKDVLKKYPARSSVNVFYNPAAPETCTLEPGAKTSSYIYYWGSLVIAALGLIVVSFPSLFNNAINQHFNSIANDYGSSSADGRRDWSTSF